jgi:predicted TIM-barrel fold metal-dependent hydrolase
MALDITGTYRYPPANEAWLSAYSEEIIDASLPIIDPHHHLWLQEGNPYLMDDLLKDLATGHNIQGTVFVQAHYGYRSHGPEHLRCVGETESVVKLLGDSTLATTKNICAGIVGYADLLLGDRLDEVLETHLHIAGKRFKGVRHSVSRDENFPDGIVLRPARAGLLADPDYRKGLAKLVDYKLSYDAMLYHQQIPELTAAAQAVPDLPIVLDHFGCIIGVGVYRGREKENFARWRKDMAELAKCPNVNIKLGGMGMIICGPQYHERPIPPGSAELAAAWQPYVETCVELFGANRCMFESNFPVDKAMFSYAVLWNAFKRIASGASLQEKQWLFHDTAKEVYRL